MSSEKKNFKFSNQGVFYKRKRRVKPPKMQFFAEFPRLLSTISLPKNSFNLLIPYVRRYC